MCHSRFMCCLLVAVSCLSILACGGKSPRLDDLSVPEWYTNPPQDPDHLYETSTQVSRDLQVAIDKATQTARAGLATQIETHISRMYQSFTEEIGAADRGVLRQLWSDTMRGLTDQTIRGSRVADSRYVKEGNGFRAYVLAELPIGVAEDQLLSRISRQEELYTEFKAAKSFQEMEERIEEFRRFKKEREGY